MTDNKNGGTEGGNAGGDTSSNGKGGIVDPLTALSVRIGQLEAGYGESGKVIEGLNEQMGELIETNTKLWGMIAKGGNAEGGKGGEPSVPEGEGKGTLDFNAEATKALYKNLGITRTTGD